MRRGAWSSPVLVASLLLAAGCSSSGTGAPPAASRPAGPTMTAPHTTAPVTPSASSTSSTHSAHSVPGDPAVHADIAAAVQHAKVTGKRVLIDFGAGWCVDCKVLDTLLENHKVAPTVRKNFAVVHVNVHNFNYNMDISRTYGNACKGGIPALVVLDGKGRMLVNTSDGSFQHARVFGPADVLKFLNKWAPTA